MLTLFHITHVHAVCASLYHMYLSQLSTSVELNESNKCALYELSFLVLCIYIYKDIRSIDSRILVIQNITLVSKQLLSL